MQVAGRFTTAPQPACAPASGGTLASVELLRGLAALSVLLFHVYGIYWRGHPPVVWSGDVLGDLAAATWPQRLAAPLTFGFLGVPLFFVISGFCIHLPYARKERLPLAEFFVRRFFRLYPLYLAVVVACFALTWQKQGWQALSGANFLGHLVFWHYQVPPTNAAMGVTPVLWTITIEVHFYLLYVLTFPLLRRWGVWRCAALALAFDLAYRAAWAISDPHLAGGWRMLEPTRFALPRFGEWLLGAWLAERSGAGALRGWRRRAAAALAIGGGALVAAGIAAKAIWRFEGGWLDLWAIGGFAALLAGAVAVEGARWPVVAPAGAMAAGRRALRVVGEWLGSRSYSMYLVHFVWLTSCVEVLFRLTHAQDKAALRGTSAMGLTLLVSVALLLVLIELTYRLIERPSHETGRRLAARIRARQAQTG